MRGFLLNVRRAGLWNRAAGTRQLEMFVASVSTGILAGMLAASVRLHLGLPGHKALFWMTPVLLARLLGRCRVGTAAGAFSAACVALGLGGHVAGGAVGLPLIGFAGLVMDAMIHWLEQRGIRPVMMIPLIAVLAMGANLIAFGKRCLVPAGPNAHYLFGFSGPWVEALSYAAFGMLAGLIAACAAALIAWYRSAAKG